MSVIRAYTSAMVKAYIRAVIPGYDGEPRISLGTGQFIVTGNDALLQYGFIPLGKGEYLMTGNSMSLLANRVLALGKGEFALTGKDVTLNADINWITFPDVLFYGLYSEISGGQMPNKVSGATDYITVSGSEGSETYTVPNTAAYKSADTDYIWFKSDETQRTTTTAELIGYDFSQTIVKYSDASPYGVEAIMILKSGTTLSTLEENTMRSDFHLSVWWSGVLSAFGNLKGNRGSARSIWSALKQATVLCYEFDEASGTTAVDATSKNNGTIVSATVNQTGKINKAYSFDETDDYVEFPDLGIFDGSKDFSVSMWAKMASLPNLEKPTYCLFSPRHEYDIHCHIQNPASPSIFFGWYASSTIRNNCTFSNVESDTWYHIVFIWNTSTSNMYMYVNNTLVDTKPIGTPAARTDKNTIGCQYFSGAANNEFHGLIDQTAIFDRLLTTNEISALYNSGNGKSFIDF